MSDPDESAHKRVRLEGPIRRSRTGCLTCRARKVKCDETPGECNKCRDMDLACRWAQKKEVRLNDTPEYAPPPLTTRQGTRPGACQSCRSAKTRCTQLRPSCTRCENHGIICVYAANATADIQSPDVGVGERMSSQTYVTPSPAKDTLSSRYEIDRLLTAYFDCVHPHKGNAFLQRGKVFREVQSGEASTYLVKAICACAARFLDGADRDHPDGGTLPAMWAQEAKVGAMANLERFSISKLATLLILVEHENSSGRFASSWLSAGMPVRMAMAMGLNDETDPTVPWAEREMRRRLMWAAFILDSHTAGGLQRYLQCPRSVVTIDLPAPEHCFTLSIPFKGRPLSVLLDHHPGSQSRLIEGSLLERFIYLYAMRTACLCYIKTAESQPQPPWEPGSTFQQCAQQLHWWKETLPPELEFTAANLYARKGTPELQPFISAHVFYDQINATLHRMTLPGFPGETASTEFLHAAPPGWVARMRHTCYTFSCGVTRKLQLVQELFPDLIPTVDTFIMYVQQACRTQIQYLAIVHHHGQPEAQRLATVAGFDAMLGFIARMTVYFPFAKRALRATVQICARHGYSVSGGHNVEAITASGARTPVLGPGVTQLPEFAGSYGPRLFMEEDTTRNSMPAGPGGLRPAMSNPPSTAEAFPTLARPPSSPSRGSLLSVPVLAPSITSARPLAPDYLSSNISLPPFYATPQDDLAALWDAFPVPGVDLPMDNPTVFSTDSWTAAFEDFDDFMAGFSTSDPISLS